MKTLIVYGSLYGNTEKVARAMGDSLKGRVIIAPVRQVKPRDLENLDLLIVGSPTQGGRPMPDIQEFIEKTVPPTLPGTKVAAFDTRVTMKWARLFGFAANRIADSLKRNGGVLVEPPEGFFVGGKTGPLKDGELRHAGRWAEKVMKGLHSPKLAA